MKGIVYLCALGALFMAGCIHSSPRNQTTNVNVREIRVDAGAAQAGSTGLPATVNVGSGNQYDQMIDQGGEYSGGTGNRTPFNLTTSTPSALGGAAEGAAKGVGQWFGGGKKDAATNADDCEDCGD